MSVNLSKELNSASKNSVIVTSESEVSHNPVSAANRRQVRVLYAIKFLTSMNSKLNFICMYPFFKEATKLNFEEFGSCIDSIESSCVTTQAFSSVGFGLISDKFGRKVALNACLLGSGLCTGLFGFSSSIKTFRLLYILNGAFDSSTSIIKTMTVDVSDKPSKLSNLAYLHYLGYIGDYVGSMIGFCFTAPYFCESEFNGNGNTTSTVITLIPCLISVSINVAAYMLSRYYLNETIYENRDNLNVENIKSESIENLDKLTKPEQSSLFGLSMSKNSKLILIGSSLFVLSIKGFLNITYNWPAEELANGDLNLFTMEKAYIAPLLFITTTTVMFKYPYLIIKLGALKVYRYLFPLTPVIFTLRSMLANFAKIRNDYAVIIPLTLLVSALRGLGYLYNTSSDLLLSESSEATKNLGTLYGTSNGLWYIADLVTKSISTKIQAICNNMFPSQLNYNSLNWGFLTTLSLTGYWISTKIKNIC